MKIKFEIENREYTADLSNPIIVSIPLIFNGEQPNTYDVEKATAKAYETGNFIGDTRKGGGCNFDEYKFITHCNGTHTECVGHISLERISIHTVLKDCLIPSTLISVTPENSKATNDNYIPSKNDDDQLITKKNLKEKLEDAHKDFCKALIIRTLPNDYSKKSRRYMANHPPFFSIDAMEYIADLKIEHLLVDIPSVDRTFDEGKLSAHHIYWDVKFESHEVDQRKHSMKTITEMIYVDNGIADGKYLTNIQIPEFVSDAAPSRVLIYEISG